MFKSKKMRLIVEAHLNQVNDLLKFAKEQDLQVAVDNYTSQKIALEHILRDFKRYGV